MTGPVRFERGMRVRLTCAPFDIGIVQGVERFGPFGLPLVWVRWSRAIKDETKVAATVLEPI